MKVAVSACLLGRNCKYNGGHNFCGEVAAFLEGKEVLPICPEILVMPAPRAPVELRGGRAVDEEGRDVDALYRCGVARTLEAVEAFLPDLVILKARSPTCSVREIYDGTFQGRLIAGSGLLAAALIRRGFRVEDENTFKENR